MKTFTFTDTQVEMLQALLFMTYPDRHMSAEDKHELKELEDMFDVWNCVSHFEADSRNSISRI